MIRLAPVLALLLVGCDETSPEAETCEPEGEAVAFVISELRFARRAEGVAPGFDLDGLAAACGQDDLMSPTGVPGVDNGFSALVPILELTEAVAAESLIAQSIAAGELMITLELEGADEDGVNWQGDDCVGLNVGRAAGVPLVGPDGVVLADQTLALDPDIASAYNTGAILNRQLVASDLSFALPLDILNAELDFEVTQGAFSVQRRFDGAVTGIMGGQIPIRQIVEILERDDVNLQSFVPAVQSLADIEGPDGQCSGLSLAFEYVALPIHLVR